MWQRDVDPWRSAGWRPGCVLPGQYHRRLVQLARSRCDFLLTFTSFHPVLKLFWNCFATDWVYFDQGSGSSTDLQLYTARPASADAYYFAHTADTQTKPPVGMKYRLGDYAESTYFGPLQGSDGVWTGVVNYTSAGFGRWAPGIGAPLAVFDPAARTETQSKWLAKPAGFELLVTGGPGSDKLNATSAMAIWRPIAPHGYTALGSIVSTGASVKPQLADVRVLHSDCVAECPARLLWCDAQLPQGRCAHGTDPGTGWSTAVYTSGSNGHPRMAVANDSVATNLFIVVPNSSEVLWMVPCIKASCLTDW